MVEPESKPQDAPSLGKAHLDTLGAYLGSAVRSDEVMTLCELDGFLAGIAAGPQAIAQAEWLPSIWGDDEPPAFAVDAEAKTVLAAIVALHAEIVALIADGTYMPLLQVDTDGAPLPEVWAAGFMTAASLRVEAWAALFESEEDDSIALPILAFCEDESGEPFFDLTTRDRELLRTDSADHIAQAVIDIADYWQAKNKPPPAGAIPVRTTPKIGRNDPCPCGSGKKYKKCCGA